MAAHLYEEVGTVSPYIDHQLNVTREEYADKLKTTSTVYVGNISYYTTEEQLYELFGLCGDVQRVIVGLDRRLKTPCGFCFVEYSTHEEAGVAINCLSGSKLDERVIRVDWDAGFKEGRQFGRGKNGAQKRDAMRTDYDKDRGGYGAAGEAEDEGDDSALKRKRRAS